MDGTVRLVENSQYNDLRDYLLAQSYQEIVM